MCDGVVLDGHRLKIFLSKHPLSEIFQKANNLSDITHIASASTLKIWLKDHVIMMAGIGAGIVFVISGLAIAIRIIYRTHYPKEAVYTRRLAEGGPYFKLDNTQLERTDNDKPRGAKARQTTENTLERRGVLNESQLSSRDDTDLVMMKRTLVYHEQYGV
ncbi:hypothetical protein DPMN_135136 [Dreissena polymorpha]|uniref:Uncharacterized protein n=2 Tax=Dreissena polymorpha TaxID=45954 RepID=A0A9D4JFI1_DREPO|nr:hypothetical protein DPMN_135136 [Dreissena polymorpha]